MSHLRFRDGEWEARCDDCARSKLACFWPVTSEFWDPKWPARCRACQRSSKKRRSKAQWDRMSEEQREAKREAMRQYRRECRGVINMKKRVASMTPAEAERTRERDRIRRANLTPEQRARRLETIRAWQRAHPEKMLTYARRYALTPGYTEKRSAQWQRRKERLAHRDQVA